MNLRHGPLLELNDYYPFGMQIPGLSTQSYKYQYNQNRYKFNGIEYDTAFGLDYYGARFRDYDPQIGRFTQIDPKVESAEGWSVYSGMLDNPILNSDPLGDSTGLPANFYINRNTDGDQTGAIRNATSKEYSENPVKALFKDIIHAGAELTGLNSVDDAGATLNNPNASTTDKVLAILNIGLSTPEEGVKGGEGFKAEARPASKDAVIVTNEGVALPKSNKYRIPSNYVENPNKKSSYGVVENGKFKEKLRVDAATPSNKKGPNYSHYHKNGKSTHYSPNGKDKDPGFN